ncbi:MAG: thiol reductant ABC exporter subunit CydD [Moraxella sp.]|nr:thiol reductant ABC exporter subunit CydD [Moraxella sp.]
MSATPSDDISSPNRPKKRQKSAEALQIQAFLKSELAPVKKTLYGAWAIDVLAVGLFIVQMYWLAWLFGALLTALQANELTKELISSLFWQVLPWLAGCLLVRPVLTAWRDKLTHTAGLAMAMNVRACGLARLGELGLARGFYGSDGALASYIVDEPDTMIGYGRFFVQKMLAVSTPVLIVLVVASQSLMAAAILLLTAPLLPVFMAFIGIATARKSREQMDAMAQLGGRFLDWLRGMSTLDRLGAVSIASADVAHAADDYKKRTMSVLKIAFLNSAVLEFFSALSIALVAVYLGFGLMGILPWASGDVLMSYQSALFILLLVPEFYTPLRKLGAEYHAKGAAEGCAKKLAPMLYTDTHWQDVAKAGQPLPSTVLSDTVLPSTVLSSAAFLDSLILSENAPAITIKDLSVTTNHRLRVQNVSLAIDSGAKVAITGHSGSGKSTILQVLLGFCAYQGSVQIAGCELRELDKQSLREMMGYLPQLPALLPISIADNLRLAKPTATDVELNKALYDVQMLSVVQALPQGIHTTLSERGGGLSGGQGQRLAIAQLLLQDAKIWLLDEPTEHLDSDTKSQISALFGELAKDKTLIWVTHDTPVEWLDKVYSLAADRQNKTADKGCDDESL